MLHVLNSKGKCNHVQLLAAHQMKGKLNDCYCLLYWHFLNLDFSVRLDKFIFKKFTYVGAKHNKVEEHYVRTISPAQSFFVRFRHQLFPLLKFFPFSNIQISKQGMSAVIGDPHVDLGLCQSMLRYKVQELFFLLSRKVIYGIRCASCCKMQLCLSYYALYFCYMCCIWCYSWARIL